MERSKAVKCPTVHYQLAGMKKIQQVLCEPGMVEKFIEDPDAASDVRETFACQYSLDVGIIICICLLLGGQFLGSLSTNLPAGQVLHSVSGCLFHLKSCPVMHFLHKLKKV
jgi:hypothetical protein